MDWRRNDRYSTIGSLRATQQPSVSHEDFDIRMAEDLRLRHPFSDVDVVMGFWERLILPFPKHYGVVQAVDGVQNCIPLGNWKGVGPYKRSPTNVDYSAF